jgi:hypothetical protein
MDMSCGLKGAKMMAELREFASFSPETQRFICQSLDIAFYPDLPIKTWARDELDADRIAAQKQVYRALPGIRAALPRISAPVDAEAFLYPLIEASAFDISCADIANFAQYRFLYERLLGARVRPWLPTAFMTAASLPYIPADIRQALIATAGDALTDDWSNVEPVYWPKLLGEDQALAA